MHYVLVECLGTQLDRRKTSNPEARHLIDKVLRVCGKLDSSPPSGDAFKNLQHISVATQRDTVQEADLVGHTAAKMCSIESGPRVKRLSTDVSQYFDDHTRACELGCPVDIAHPEGRGLFTRG